MKKNLFRIIFNSLIIVGSIIWMFYYYNVVSKEEITIIDSRIENDQIILQLNDKGRCSLTGGVENSNWIATDENNACVFPLVDNIETVYLRNKYSTLSEYHGDFSQVINLEIDHTPVYLAIDDTATLTYNYEVYGNIDGEVKLSSSDESVATIDENGLITAISDGVATISATLADKVDSKQVTVTSLIVKMPDEYDDYKPFLPCGIYSEEENDLLEEILRARVDEAGRGTRAGVVAAARFLELEFPYVISYFTENGRLTSHTNRFADGEGRYYHDGMYLHTSRIENLDPKYFRAGPVPWGCSMYEYDSEKPRPNGLDCSGYISWVLKQGGFDPGDLGAGIAKEWEDLTDLGEKVPLREALDNGTLRVGDLLSSDFVTVGEGGHIAMVIGIKDGYYYVSDALFYRLGVSIRKFDREGFLKNFIHQVDMTNYYPEDGNLTDYWNE